MRSPRSLQDSNDLANLRVEAKQRRDDLLTLRQCSLSERYLESELSGRSLRREFDILGRGVSYPHEIHDARDGPIQRCPTPDHDGDEAGTDGHAARRQGNRSCTPEERAEA